MLRDIRLLSKEFPDISSLKKRESAELDIISLHQGRLYVSRDIVYNTPDRWCLKGAVTRDG
jgi:hypothetical protein